MYELCRHIMPAGPRCGSPAIKNTPFCFNHTQQRRRLAKITPVPDPYGWDPKPLPLVPPEDRAAIQLNYSIVIAALTNNRITMPMANCLNRLLRSCEINLSHGPLFDPATEPVRAVALTPDGDEIASPDTPSSEALDRSQQNPDVILSKRQRSEESALPQQHDSAAPPTDVILSEVSVANAVEEPALSLPKGPAFVNDAVAHTSDLGSRGEQHNSAAPPTDVILSEVSVANAVEEPALSLPKGPAFVNDAVAHTSDLGLCGEQHVSAAPPTDVILSKRQRGEESAIPEQHDECAPGDEACELPGASGPFRATIPYDDLLHLPSPEFAYRFSERIAQKRAAELAAKQQQQHTNPTQSTTPSTAPGSVA